MSIGTKIKSLGVLQTEIWPKYGDNGIVGCHIEIRDGCIH